MASITKKKPSRFGGHEFSEVFQRSRGGDFKFHYITLPSVVEWLGDGWNLERCTAILEAEPWIKEAFSADDGGGVVGLSPFGVAMLVVHGGDSVGLDLKLRAADLVNAWIERRSGAAKAYGAMNRR